MPSKLSLTLLYAVTLAAALAVPVQASAQQTIYVYGTVNFPYPGYPYKTIQSGIDAASNGDTVVVLPGPPPYYIYSENIDFKGKAITVTGLPPGADPATAILPTIQGALGTQGVLGTPSITFQSGETSDAVFSYFNVEYGGGPPTIGGNEMGNGAIYVYKSSPSILNNTISQSFCSGIYVDEAAPLIQGNTISGTVVFGTGEYAGENICGTFGGPGIFIQNDLELPSGAIAATHVIGNIIENNIQAGLSEGDNDGVGGGGGITVYGASLIQGNTIRDNASGASGAGGINVTGATGMVISQNLIYGNSSNCGGGGIALPDSGRSANVVLMIANNTIVNNTSTNQTTTNCAPSAQILSVTPNDLYDGPGVVIVNNILSGNTPEPAANCALDGDPSEEYQPIFDHNILRNTGGSFFGPNCIDVSTRYGNLTADPLFNNEAANDFTLKQGSPAIDAGNTSAVQLFHQLSSAQLTTDLNNNPRVVDATGVGYPIVDIGAYEYTGSVDATPTTIVLGFASYLQNPNTPYQATATVNSALGVPVGDITFLLDGTSIGSATINSAGVATLTGFYPLPGVHSLLATYAGYGRFQPAISIINIIDITLINVSIFLSYSTPDILNQPITFTIGAHAEDSSIPSPITVTNLTTNTQLATLLPDTSGSASFTTTKLIQGTNDIQASYAGTSVYAPASVTVPVDVTGYPTTTTLTCGPLTTVPLGATIPLTATVTSNFGMPAGIVTFANGRTALGQSALANSSATFTGTTVPGFNTFYATFNQQGSFDLSSGSCSVQVIGLDLISSLNPAPAYSPITFTASIPVTPVPTGTYSITIGTNPPVSMTASADGSSATYTTGGLAQGSYPVTATFTPIGQSAPYVATLTEKVTAAIGDFNLTGPSTITAQTEATGTGTLTLTSVNNFSGPVTLTCSLPLPATYACTLSQSNVTLAVGGIGTSTLALAPTNTHTALNHIPSHTSSKSLVVLASLFPLSLLSLAGFAHKRRTGSRIRSLLCLAMLAILAGSTTACGPNIFYAATPPGNYPLTITATGTTLGGTAPATHTLTITLDLTP